MSSGDPAFDPTVVAAPAIPEHELLRPIASGAYGHVWLARNTLGSYRAVKIVHRGNFDHERPFEREFAGIKAFEPISHSHEGLVDLLQVGRDDAAGYFYYVMELADALEDPKSEIRNPKEGRNPKAEPMASTSGIKNGFLNPQQLESYVPRTLGAELKRRGRLPLEDCIRIGLSLTQALGYLHKKGLLHRDVKPSNIIFVRGIPKLADVGLVAGVSEARSFVGTVGFIPPEGPGTPQADIYSLGIVLYVMSTGKNHQDFPEPLPDLAAEPEHGRWLEFNTVVHKACQAEAPQRYQSAQELHDDLALLQRGQSVKRKFAMQRRWALARKLALAAIILVALLVPLGFLNAFKAAYTPKREARRLYELGRWYYNQCTPKDHAKAFDYLTQAVQMDPKFPQPYTVLMGLYGWSTVPGVTNDQQRLQRLWEIVGKLMVINPDSAEAHTAVSFCRFLQRDWRQAEQEIQRAVNANPDYAFGHFMYCFYLSLEGRAAEAEREGQKAQALEPPDAARMLAIAAAWPFEAERRFDLAIAQLKQVLELDRNFAYGHSYLADCYNAQSNYVAALEEYRTCYLLEGGDPARVAEVFESLRQAYDTGGTQAYLRRWTDVILTDEALPDDQQMFSDSSNTDLAGYYARLGAKEKALDDLEKHFDEPNVWSQIKFDPMYDSLHDEPRFKALVKRAGLGN
jgi:serine/threonine protein kinase